MRTVSICEAKAGKSIAKLGSINKKPQRQFGVLKGKIKISKDFDAPLSEEFSILGSEK